MSVTKKSLINYKTLIHIFFILSCFTFIVPFIYIISVSFSGEKDIMQYGYRLIPKNIDFTAYRFVFSNPQQLIDSYKVTTAFSILGTFLSVIVMALCAYPLSRKNFKYRKMITFYIFFTMLFGGGLVPSYILITQYLGLRNSFWVYIWPSLANAFHIIIFRTFFQGLTPSLIESAKIDGASELLIFYKIVLPLSKPVIATIALFGILGRWNNWFTSLLYIQDSSLYSLQFLLQKILLDLHFLQENIDRMPPGVDISDFRIPAETVRMAILIIAAGPMLVVFPFFQKYFTKGLTIGAVKG